MNIIINPTKINYLKKINLSKILKKQELLLRALSTIMPPKRQFIGQSTAQAQKKRALRASETDEQCGTRLGAR